MTHNSVTVPLHRLKLPAFVEYDGAIYRAWKQRPVVKPGGTSLDATDTSGRQFSLYFANENATVEMVVG